MKAYLSQTGAYFVVNFSWPSVAHVPSGALDQKCGADYRDEFRISTCQLAQVDVHAPVIAEANRRDRALSLHVHRRAQECNPIQ